MITVYVPIATRSVAYGTQTVIYVPILDPVRWFLTLGSRTSWVAHDAT
jgi:hypothetical protein